MNIKEIYTNTFKEMPSPEFCAKLHPSLYPFYLKRIYKFKTGKNLNLNNPKTFCEKIQWLKLYQSTPEKTRLADKILVRDYVKEKIGSYYLKPVVGIYDSFEEINFNELPEIFVLKTNHACETNNARKKSLISEQGMKNLADFYEKKLKENYAFKNGFELHYSDIKPKIFVEKYVPKIIQYCAFCFDGEVEYIHVEQPLPEGMGTTWYDTKYNKLPFDLHFYTNQIVAPIDTKIAEEVIECSKKLSKGFSLVRCDFAFCRKNNKLYFEEMTFTPTSGFGYLAPYKYEYEVGEKLTLQ